MWQLLTAIAEILVRRRGPDTLPDSAFLVGLLLVVDLIMGVVDLAFYDLLDGNGLANLAAQTALLFAYVFALLTFFKLERRFKQTMSALLGVDILVYLVFVPIAVGGMLLGLDLESAGFLSIRLGLYLWWIVIVGWIFARSLSESFILGLMFSILYVLPSWSISGLFAPPIE